MPFLPLPGPVGDEGTGGDSIGDSAGGATQQISSIPSKVANSAYISLDSVLVITATMVREHMGLNGPFFIQCKHFYCVFNGTRGSIPKLTISIFKCNRYNAENNKEKNESVPNCGFPLPYTLQEVILVDKILRCVSSTL